MKLDDHRSYTWARLIKNLRYAVSMIVWLLGASACVAQATDGEVPVVQVLARVEAHEFHPLNNDNAFTTDRTLREHGIADLTNSDWRVRLLAVRDAVLHFIQARFPTFKLTFSKTTRSSYLANTCPKCKVISGDFYLHPEPGGAFFPTTEEEAKQITVEAIPLQGSFEVRAGLGMGTGDIILRNGRKKSAEPGNPADYVQPLASRSSVHNG